ncbi:unnamed protein product [marine sediment metagenome]|uniref:Uncharacterized protein n=1 Tax=marine sediment metagenome TaxID=412755 RepID=X0T0C6_9ZZZZ
MDEYDERVENAARHTEILRHPRQHLSTFGITNIYYYLVTEPVYTELVESASETVIREGRVIAERPKIVTPYYLTHLEGFSYDARKYFEMLLRMHGADTPGLLYTYKNEPKELNIVSDSWMLVVEKLNRDIDARGDPMTSIIKGQDDLWDVSLLKFIYEITSRSLQSNIAQLGSRGLLGMSHGGVPIEARQHIEELFTRVASGECPAHDLEAELNRWGVFPEYQDRFFALVKDKK